MNFRDDQNNSENEEIDNTKQERIKALLVRIGEKSASPLHKNLEMLSRALTKDLAEHSDFILDIMMQCIVHLTTKTGVYGTLVGLLNLQEPQFGKVVVERISRDLKISLESCDFSRINILIRFTAELQNTNVISAKDFVANLNLLLRSTENLPQKIADFFFYCVIGTLPYSGSDVLHKLPDETAELLRLLHGYYEQRKPDASLQYRLAIKDGEKDGFLDVYWLSLVEASREEWKTDVVVSPAGQFAQIFAKNISHSFSPSFERISDFKDKERPNFCNLLRIFDSEESSDKKSVRKDISRCILFEYYSDIALYFEDSKNECVRQILYLTEQNSSNYLLVESIFSLLLQLPFTQSNAVFYGCIIAELFKAKPKIFPKIVGKCVAILFDKIDLMDIECRDRLSSWFSFHLSNFGFKWAWGNWSFVSTLPSIAPKRVFCESVLRGCTDLSSSEMNLDNEELKSLIPNEMAPHFKFRDVVPDDQIADAGKKKPRIGSEPQASPENGLHKASDAQTGKKAQDDGEASHNKEKSLEESMVDEEDEICEKGKRHDWLSSTKEYSKKNKSPLDPSSAAALQMLQLLESKDSAEAVYELLGQIKTTLGEEETFENFFQCILFAGAGSFSDLFRVFDKYKPAIVRHQPSESVQKAIVKTTLVFWADSHLHLVIILQKLITYGFIKTKYMVEVLLAEKHLAFFYKPFYSTVFTNLLDLFSQRIVALKKILDKDALEKDDKNRGDLMEKILATNNDRQAMLKTILERLKLAADYFIKNVENYHSNELYKVIFGRFVMFLRRYSETVNEMKAELRDVFKNDDGTETTKAYLDLQ